MMPVDQKKAIDALRQAVPSLSMNEARQWLERNGWNVQEATQAAKKRQAFFVGGSSAGGSGQEVIAPHDTDALIESIFDQARAGAEQRGEQGEFDDPTAFFGRGRRLGHTEAPSPFIAAATLPSRTLTVTVYRNGLQVNDEALIPRNSPEGAEFLDVISKGFVPPALSALYPNTNLNINLRDCTDHDYEEPAYRAFHGEGHRLTSSAATSTSPSANTTVSYTSNHRFEPCSESEVGEATVVRLVAQSGEKKEVSLHPIRHTVEDLYFLAHEFQPQLAHFVLVSRELPPRRLTDEMRGLSVEAARLKRATVSIQTA